MDNITTKELVSRRSEIEADMISRQKQIALMLKERSNLIILSNAVQQWAGAAETIERFSQGNPTLKSYREACINIKSGIKDMRDIVEELSKASIPNFDAVADAIDRMDTIADEDQQTGTNVEEFRAVIGEACGSLDVIIELLYT